MQTLFFKSNGQTLPVETPSYALFNTMLSSEDGILESQPEIDTKVFRSSLTSSSRVIYQRIPTGQISTIKNYDAREDWKIPGTNESALTLEALDQAGCGSCWAFAAASMFSDRYRIQLAKNAVTQHPLYEKIDVWTGETNIITADGVVNPNASKAEYGIYPVYSRIQLSIYYTASFTDPPPSGTALEKKLGCGGNYIYSPLKLFVSNGLPTSRYYNIKDWICSDVDKKNRICKDTRIVAGPGTLYKAQSYKVVINNKGNVEIPGNARNMEEFMMSEIYERGPITVAMSIFESFYAFFDTRKGGDVKGIYAFQPPDDKNQGGHAVNIVGWGETSSGLKYWIVKNSWGPKWGDNGYFKIKKGSNFCGIETEVGYVTISPTVSGDVMPTPTPTPTPTPVSPINCEVSEWSEWNNCSSTCGGGIQMRTRTIKNNPQNRECPILAEIKNCNINACSTGGAQPKINCKVSDWSNWSTCSESCGGGMKSRSRTILENPQHGGDTCPVLVENEKCNTHSCAKNNEKDKEDEKDKEEDDGNIGLASKNKNIFGFSNTFEIIVIIFLFGLIILSLRKNLK